MPPDSHQAGRLLSNYASNLYQETGDYERAQDAANLALAIARREQDLALEMRTLVGAAVAAWWRLSLPELVAYGQQAVELTSRVDDPASEVLVRSYMGCALAAMGDSERAQLDGVAMLTTAERLRDRGRVYDAIVRNTELCFFRGDWQEAYSLADRGKEVLPQPLQLLSLMAVMAYEEGDFDGGAVIIDRIVSGRSRTAIEFSGFT